MSNTVFIMGAPRSGTNLLRDLLTSDDRMVTWDCDEINTIWRFGNYLAESDEDNDMVASPRIKDFIHSKFNSLTDVKNKVIVEKTCANSLRPNFIHDIFPAGKFIIIQRNGFDCALSAKKKVIKGFDLKYQLAKWKYAPLVSLYYIYKSKRAGIWGPHYKNMELDIKSKSALEVAAIQWKKCNEALLAFEGKMTPSQLIRIRYEDLVNNPEEVLKELTTFIFGDSSVLQTTQASTVYKSSVGNASRHLTKSEILLIEKYILETNKKLGYDPN